MTAAHASISQEGSICTPEPLQELERLQKYQIIVLLVIEEASEWCNSFILVPKANGKVWLCLDLARLKKAMIILVHRGSSLNDIPLRLAGIKYLTLIEASSGYHILNLTKSHHI